MKRLIWLLVIGYWLLTFVSCQRQVKQEEMSVPCAEALKAYVERYPAAEPADLYKLVFQDLYGPGHLLTDSADCHSYIRRELQTMGDSTAMPPYEYTLCDSNFVRVNLTLVADGTIDTAGFVSAVMRSAEGMVTPDPRFVMRHSDAFREAYNPHYRIVRRDIFEQEMLPLINKQ